MKRLLFAGVTTLLCASSAFAAPKFVDFPVDVYQGNHRVDASGKIERQFKTTLKDAAKKPVEFAGKYVFVSWGCGTGCVSDGLLNVQTGKYSPLELDGFTHQAVCSNTKSKEGQLVAKPDSRLLVVIGAKYDGSAPLSGEEETCSSRYYLESNGKIVPLK